jgi:glycosyl transferase family 4/glycosyl transferase family 1
LPETNILFIAMEFVPLNLGGVFRPLRFVNSLYKNGIQPIIITFADDPHLRKVHSRFDYGLMEKLDKGIEIYRIPLDDISEYYNTGFKRFRNIWFNTSDNFLNAWEKNLYRELPAIIAKHRPRAIFVTCPPFSAATLGARISKQYDIPLILDMRDAWAQVWLPSGTYLHYLRKRNAERKAFEQASAVITVTPRLKTMFEETHRHIPARKYNLIYNGYDFELPASLSVGAEGIAEKGAINIGYVGAFYYDPELRNRVLLPWWKRSGHRMLQYSPIKEDWLYRSPYFFFKALADLFDRRPEWRSKIFFHHIGDTPEWLTPMAEELGVKENIVLHGFQVHEKTLELQQSFDLLLATSEKVIGNEHYCLPSKLFTYLRAGKPVLGFVTPGIQHDFISKSNMGPICDPDDPGAASRTIEKIVEDGYRTALDIEYLHQFSNTVATGQLVETVRRIVS